MTDKEKLEIVEKNLRKRRLSARQTASLLRQHERLTKKIAGEEPRIGRPPNAPESKDCRQRFLSTLVGDERLMWEHVYRIEDERRAQARPRPEQDPAPSLTPADAEALLRGHYASAVKALTPAQTEIKADVE